MNPIRFGIVGLGNIGGTHVKRFLNNEIPGTILAGVCDSDPSVLANYPALKTWESSAELIRSGEIDALIIAVPHYDHVTIGIDALNNGLHVLCEKPLAVHKADAQRLLAAHTNPKQIFAAMFDTRTEPRYQALKDFIATGQLGPIRRINWILTTWFRSNAYYASSAWRATWDGEGGGMLVNQLPHDLDLFQWLFGLPKRVRAHCPIGKYHPIEVEDEVNALFEYADGTTGVLVATTGECPGVDRREIIGDFGRVIVNADHLEFTRTVVPTSEFTRTTKELWGRPDSEVIKIPVTGTAGRHSEVIRQFVAAISEGKPLVAQAAEGLNSVELANAIILSSQLDRTVELPLDAAAFEAWLNTKRATSSFKARKAAAAPRVVADMSASFN
ncbi:MAG: Gfo/Idh/MocA family oxidoreductase [Opitutaceae bacterium]|nr:Gfo/Idh/MocA family oxidoreductase [Opitutaceae bacterium]